MLPFVEGNFRRITVGGRRKKASGKNRAFVRVLLKYIPREGTGAEDQDFCGGSGVGRGDKSFGPELSDE